MKHISYTTEAQKKKNCQLEDKTKSPKKQNKPAYCVRKKTLEFESAALNICIFLLF